METGCGEGWDGEHSRVNHEDEEIDGKSRMRRLLEGRRGRVWRGGEKMKMSRERCTEEDAAQQVGDRDGSQETHKE